MSAKLRRILIAGCAFVACLHAPRAVSLLRGDGAVQAAETQARQDAEAAAPRAPLLAGQAPIAPFTALLGTDSVVPGS